MIRRPRPCEEGVWTDDDKRERIVRRSEDGSGDGERKLCKGKVAVNLIEKGGELTGCRKRPTGCW